MSLDLYGVDIPAAALPRLEVYKALLLKWQKAINLVSGSTLDQAWQRHFIDSAQVSQFIPKGTKVYADLGCGGGFPGLVLAIMHPELAVHLVESDERKGQFMRTVARETEAKNVTVHTSRIEAVTDDFVPDFITARALSSLPQLFTYCLPWAEQNADLSFCFMKGERATEEIEAAEALYRFDVQAHASVTDPRAQLLTIQNLARL